MLPEVVTALHSLRPEEGLGEGIDQLAALLHHAYLFWDAGSITAVVSPEKLSRLLGLVPGESERGSPQAPRYVHFPERRIWAQVIPEHAPEPLDGCFVHAAPDPQILRVLGVFGMHAERPGFSVVETSGPRPTALVRPDATPLFSPILPGGSAAGLFSLTGDEELLELGWRTQGWPASSLEAD
jgi:hypothetical protein